MSGHIEVYEHALISTRAKRVLCALVTAFALVIGPWSVPAHAADGLVTGTVTDANGNPLPGVLVVVHWLHNTSNPHFDAVNGDETDATGAFALGAPAGTVRVQFYGTSDHAGEWYDDAVSLADATDLPLSGGATVTADAELAEYGSLDGHVDRQAGDPQARSVALLDPVTGVVRGRTAVGADGAYSFARVVPGSYKVSFNRLSGFASSAAQFWEDTTEHSGLGAADVVTVDAAEAVSGIDATLVEGGHITGSLVDQAGSGMSCRLQAYTADGSLVTRAVTSAANGSFDLSGLSTGGYLVRVLAGGDCGNGRQYLTSSGGALSLVGAAAAPVAVTLGGAASTGQLVYQMGLFANLTPPRIVGTPTVGGTLTVDEGTWTLPNPTLSFRYEWLVDGVPEYTTWSDSLVLDDDVLGSTISVRVHARRTGYRSQTAATAPVGPVTLGLVNLTAPWFTGVLRVGESVTATPGTWGQAGTSFRYRWQVGTTTVQESSDPRLALADSLYGARLSITVTASKPGYADTQVTSTLPTVVSKGALTFLTKGRIKGTAAVGQKLKLKPPKFNVAPTAVTYSWRRNGRMIAGAKGPRYTVVAKDLGTKLSLMVSYSRAPAWLPVVLMLKVRGGPIGGRVTAGQ